MGAIYSVHDVRAVHTTLTVRCQEPELANSQFGYPVHWWLCSVHCTHGIDGKINFNEIYL